MTTILEHVRAIVEPFAAHEPYDEDAPTSRGKTLYRDRIAAVADWACSEFRGDILEIGCYAGATSARLATVARDHGRRLTCVDSFKADGHYDGIDTRIKAAFYESIRLFGPSARVIEADSHAISTVTQIQLWEYCFVFVDGGHYFEDAIADILMAMPVTRGVICVDDIALPDVQRAIREARQQKPTWDVMFIGHMSEAWMAQEEKHT